MELSKEKEIKNSGALKINGPSFYELLTFLPTTRTGLLQPLLTLHQKYGDVIYIPQPGDPIYFFNLKESMREFFIEKISHYHKSYYDLERFMGKGLITADGEQWKGQKKLMAQFFKPNTLKSYEPVINQECEKSIDYFSQKTEDSIQVKSELLRYTLNIVCRTLFSSQLDHEVRQIGEGVDQLLDYVIYRYRSTFKMPFGSPSLRYLRYKKSKKNIDILIDKWIDQRRRNPQKSKDLLDVLLEWADQQGDQLDDQQKALEHVRHQVITMVFAGHETTTHTLCWALYLLAKNPEWHALMREELKQCHDLSYESLKKTKFLFSYYLETLRLYPPVWYIERVSNQVTELSGYTIPKGKRVAVSPYLLHRNEKYWPHSKSFAPLENFPNNTPHDPLAFIPYGLGARACIGKMLAESQILVFLAHFILKFDVALDPKEKAYDFDPLITLKPKNEMPLIIRKCPL